MIFRRLAASWPARINMQLSKNNIAKIIISLWAVYWSFFVWATVASNGFTSAGSIVGLVISSLLIWNLLLVFYWSKLGQYFLLAEAVLLIIVYLWAVWGKFQPGTILLVLITMVVPLLIVWGLNKID